MGAATRRSGASGASGAPDSATRALTLAEEMKPVLLVMRGLNIMPIRFLAGGRVAPVRARSPLAALMAALWLVTVADALVELRERVDLLRGVTEFSDAVFQAFFLMLVHHHFLAPALHWRAGSDFAGYLANWDHFQESFLSTTGAPLRVGVRSLASHKGAAAVVVPVVLAVAVSSGFDSNWHNTPLGLHAASFHAVIPSFWDVLGSAVVNASDALSRRLAEEVSAAAGALEPSRVRAYRDLWLELRDLAESATQAWGACTIHYLLCCVSAVLLNGFGLMAEVTQVGACTIHYLLCCVSAVLLNGFGLMAEVTQVGACTIHYLLCCVSAVLLNGFGLMAEVTQVGACTIHYLLCCVSAVLLNGFGLMAEVTQVGACTIHYLLCCVSAVLLNGFGLMAEVTQVGACTIHYLLCCVSAVLLNGFGLMAEVTQVGACTIHYLLCCVSAVLLNGFGLMAEVTQVGACTIHYLLCCVSAVLLNGFGLMAEVTQVGACTIHYLLCCVSAVLLNGFGLMAEVTQVGACTIHYLLCCVSAVLLNGFGLMAEVTQVGACTIHYLLCCVSAVLLNGFGLMAEVTQVGACTIHYLLCCVSAVLLNGFGLMAEVTQGADANLWASLAMLLITVDSLWHTAVVCGAGHRMAVSVGGGARDVLLGMSTSAPGPRPAARQAAHHRRSPSLTQLQTEVESFLRVIKMPMCISLNGFITLRLTLIVTIVDRLVTYLCVLLQFTINFRFSNKDRNPAS
ncbi:Gustatory and odorant receptor 22 [Frankliniella fusca]|uniref:Gustatory and odorant receptor 22 n=1 Tax=Frankliniella fusca TaxID=407009 RepID=A0AAE1LBK4_9NEOP|nr:Gustatory and odorant receptor 22 [Frankliniella fusca]